MAGAGSFVKLYVWKKAQLFPLIEKYSGVSLRGRTHGEAIAIYTDLLKSDPAFTKEVRDLIIKYGYKDAAGVLGAVSGLIGNVLDIFGRGKDSDAEFAKAILEEQRAKNTQTLFIFGGITLVSLSLIGIAIYVAVKKKKQ